ncbi:uncharacterized protein LOC118202771 [Stegodyphus dumicola]|uniref:uncharacterized protein LOC118202771 n=1 Tax=Stegodyphus dumicola TaxID=202533 RepID=UPI0015ABE47F|nr:uncharacterized protein LOC118202771 [Stegodyphus dumicola]
MLFIKINNNKAAYDAFVAYIKTVDPTTEERKYSANGLAAAACFLGKPHDCDFWIDINYDSRSISFFCADLDNESSESWDTILIRADAVDKYLIKDHENKKTKELLLTLNCECNELICSSEVEFTRFKSKTVKIELFKYFDIQPHLEKIYGNMLLPNSRLLQRVEDRKVSGSVLIVQNRSELKDVNEASS